MAVNKVQQPTTGIDNFFKGVATLGKKALERADFLVTNTDALNRVSKLALAIIGFISTILKAFVPGAGEALTILSKLKVGPEGFVSITNATSFIERIFDFSDKKKFEENSETKLKLLKSTTLFAGQFFETVIILDNLSVFNIGVLGSNMTGNLSIIAFVKNLLIAVSSLCGIGVAGKTLKTEYKKLVTDGDPKSPASKLELWKKITWEDVKKRIDRKPSKYKSDTLLAGFRSYKELRYETKVSNAHKGIKKAWISIAADASKFAIVVLSSIALMLMVSAPVALIVVSACGLLAASCGLVKVMYKKFGPEEGKIPNNIFDIQKNPVAA